MLLCVVAFLILALANDEIDTKKKNIYNDPDPYKNLLDWLRDGKADIAKVTIDVKSEGYRSLRAAQYIRQGEWILFIPRTHYLSLDEVKKNCLINRKMIQMNYDPNNPQVYFANHLMQENRRKNSFWKPYIDVLPKDVSGFPSHFDSEQMALLKGSPTLFNVEQQRKTLKDEYDGLLNTIQEFKKFGYQYPDYLKYRILTFSRSFPVIINEKEQQQLLVPLADFINHDNNGFIMYGFSQEHDGFFMQAARNIQKGEELFYNYGQWSNKYFLMNYGFASLSNPMNQYDFDLCLRQDDRMFKIKLEMTMNNMCFGNRLVNETDHDTFRQTLGTARFIAMDRLDELLTLEDQTAGYQRFWPGWHTVPQSIHLEKRTFALLRDVLVAELNGFASTIEDDQRRLQDPNTPEYRKHIITLTMMEKQIVQKNIEVCNLMLSVLDKSSEELKQIIRYYNYRDIARYLTQYIIPFKQEEGL